MVAFRGFLLLVAGLMIIGLLVAASEPALAHSPHDPIHAMAVAPDGTIFIATGELSVNPGVYLALKSTDRGITWKVMPFENVRVTGFTVSPAESDGAYTVFASTLGKGIYKSTDEGECWTAVFTDTLEIRIVAISPDYSDDEKVFAVSNGSIIYRTANGGTTWTPVKDFSTITKEPIRALVVSPLDPVSRDHTLFLGTRDADPQADSGVYKSTDDGVSWDQVVTGLTNLDIQTLSLSPAYITDTTLFAGTYGGGLFVSTNGGSMWVATSLAIKEVLASVLSPHYTTDHTIFVTTSKDGVYKSTDGGASWHSTAPIGRPLALQAEDHFLHIALSPTYGGEDRGVFMGAHEGFWKSENDGDVWKYGDVLPSRLVRSLEVVENGNGLSVFASSYGGGVMRALDGGHSWEAKNTGLHSEFPHPLVVSPYSSDVPVTQMVITGIYNGIEISEDQGESWDRKFVPDFTSRSFVRALALSPDSTYMNGHTITIFAGNNTVEAGFGSGGVFKSTDAGEHWTQVLTAPIYSLAVSPDYSPEVSGVVLAGSMETEGRLDLPGLWRSMDQGESWIAYDLNQPYDYVVTIAFSPAYTDDHTIFVGTAYHGVYSTTNSGEDWEQIAGTVGHSVTDLVLSPNFERDGMLYYGTMGDGLRKSTDRGATWQDAGLDAHYITAMGISPVGALFMGTYEGLYKGAADAVWTPLDMPSRYEERSPRITYSGTWTYTVPFEGDSCSHVKYSRNPSDRVEFDFVGSGVTWIGRKGPQYGSVIVNLDGITETIFLKSAHRLFQQEIYSATNLPLGFHTLAITLLEDKIVAIDAFEVSP
jgi:photosystem II stability/assembly factor-like uncharacterized protein